jgi:sterol O-acyltransferase
MQRDMPNLSPAKPRLEGSARPAPDAANMRDARLPPKPSALAAALANAVGAAPASGTRTPSSMLSTGSPTELAAKGRRYILTADDAEIRAMLLERLEREASAAAPDHPQISGGGADAERRAPAKKRVRLRDLVFTQSFSTFDRQNPLSAESPFHGFFTLFWLGIALLLVKTAALNYRATGSVLGGAEVLHIMFDRDIVVLGLTDGVMVGSTVFGLGLQKLVLADYVRWRPAGWAIQNMWQTVYLAAIIAWTYYRDWPWTHTIFIVLHTLVFVMKQHSYAFYNGYRE